MTHKPNIRCAGAPLRDLAAGIAVVAVVCVAVASRPASAATSCAREAVAALNVPNATITSAMQVAATPSDSGYCDVLGTLKTTGEGAPAGSAQFEVKLPAAWNGKFLYLGVGGFAGTLRPAVNGLDLQEALPQGYAVAISDTGHTGNGPFDARWAMAAPGRPDRAKLADYYFRATHQVTIAAKRLVQRYYAASAIRRAYFDGCSNGGRMGLTEAARYPEDYDGIIAGAPYMDVPGTNLSAISRATAFIGAYIPPPMLAKIDAAVLATCDANDGTKDGLIQNPARCGFDPAALQCKAGNNAGCLNEAQVGALKSYLAAIRDKRGHVVYHGMSVADLSSEFGLVPWEETSPPSDPAAAQPWGGGTSPIMWLAGDGTARFFIYADPGFDTRLVDVKNNIAGDNAIALYRRKLAVGSADDPARLAAFLKKGKKLILYHGFADAALSPYTTVRYYRALARRMGGYAKAQQQVHLFMVPGLAHCRLGPGPNSFDTLGALDAWVEHGAAPDGIVATKYVHDKPADGVARTMPLCKFPEAARYDGKGDMNGAKSWHCDAADHRMAEIGPNGAAAGLSR
jgi:feruloyl esterase